MIYRIVLDGYDIYGTTEDMAVVSPAVHIELNAAGSLEFTLPCNHVFYDTPNILRSDVEVYEDDKMIWFGRVLEIEIQMNKDKKISCEGPLAWFNDTIQRPRIFDDVSIKAFFAAVIDNHNAQVAPNRQFTVGNITIADVNVYRELNYEKTKDVIENMCLNAEGGYLFFRKEDGFIYVDWLYDMPYESSQPVQFGLNLVDLSQHIDGSTIRTAILPLGKEIDGVKVTITELNNGFDYLINSEAAERFGRVIEVVEFSEIGTAMELMAAAQNWLESQQFDPMTIECNAAELYHLNNNYSPFRVGQMVRVTSMPHLIDKTLPLTTIDINLDSAVKKVKIGTQEKRELSEITKPNSSSSGYSGGSKGSSYS